MPKFDTSGEIAQSSSRTPGRWLCVIPKSFKVGEKPPRPGVETIDNRTGQPRRAQNTGHEMWSATAQVIDDHPEAPKGAFIFGLNLLWGGKGRDATYALLEKMGHPIRDWKKITDPKQVPDITPDFFYERPFVLDCTLNGDGFLEPNGFCPYGAPSSPRGPHVGGAAQSKNGGKRGGAQATAPAATGGAGAEGDELPF